MKALFEVGDILSPLEEGYPQWEKLTVRNSYISNGTLHYSVKLRNGGVIEGFNLSGVDGVKFEKVGSVDEVEQMIFTFRTNRIYESQLDIIRQHGVKIMEISPYVGAEDYVTSIDITIEGDIDELNKLAIAFNAETDQYGYIVR